MFKRYTFFFVLIISMNCKNQVGKQCQEICQFSLQCVEKNQSNSLISTKERENFEIQCFNSCTMLQDEFITCYESHQKSCREYVTCLIRSDIFQ